MATQSQGHQIANAHPPRFALTDEELYERVSRKAYELYQQRGEEPGHDIEDWLTAERLVHEELCHGPSVEEPILEENDDNEDVEVQP
jgi:hypothetical protein